MAVGAAIGGAVIGAVGSSRAASTAARGQGRAADTSLQSDREQREFLNRQRLSDRGDIFGLRDTWLASQQEYGQGIRGDLQDFGGNLRSAFEETATGTRGYLQSEADTRLGIFGGERGKAEGRFDPYINTGLSSLGEMSGLAGSPLDVDVTQDPGYQFRLSEGIKGIENSAAARGTQLSGRNLKDIGRFSQGLASQEYGAAYGRAQGLRGERLRALSELSKGGQAATAGLTGLSTALAGQEAGSIANLSGTVPQYAGAVQNLGLSRQDPGDVYSGTLGAITGTNTAYTSNTQQSLAQSGSNAAQYAANQGAIGAARTQGIGNALGSGLNALAYNYGQSSPGSNYSLGGGNDYQPGVGYNNNGYNVEFIN